MSKKTYKLPCNNSNNKKFLKEGCPEEYFDRATGYGCPKWKEYTTPGEPGKPPKIMKGCLDDLKEHWAFMAVRLLEGNQVAMEKLKNGLCEEVDGHVVPKMDRAVLGLMSMMQRGKEDRHLLDKAGKTKIIE